MNIKLTILGGQLFAEISGVLDELKDKGVLEYDYDRQVQEAEAVGSVIPAATTWYTLRVKKTSSNYLPEPFPGDILAEVARVYNQPDRSATPDVST